MKKILFVMLELAAIGLVSSSLFAQSAPEAPVVPGPPILPINSAAAVSTELFGAISSVRELPDGRLLVNDGTRRRLLLMDSTLKTVAVVLDSLTDVANSYGTRAGGLIPIHGDSTLFVDPASLALLVIDPAGKLVRTRAIWRSEHATNVSTLTTGQPRTDARGRVVYRIPAQAAPPLTPPPAGVPYFPSPPDSAFLVAVDLETRMLDTLTSVRIPKQEYTVRLSASGALSLSVATNPMPVADDWAVLSDGRVAVVRYLDYRIDYLNPDGSWSSSQRIPFDWRRLTDEDKRHVVDSVRTTLSRSAETSYALAMIRWVNNYRQQYPPSFQVPAGFVLTQGLPEGWRLPGGLEFPAGYIYGCPVGVQPTMLPGPAGGGAAPSAPGGRAAAQPPPGALPPGAPALPPGGNATIVVRGPEGAAAAGATSPQAPGSPAGGPATSGVPSCIPQPTTNLAARVPAPPSPPNVNVMSAETLPDFRPPFPTTNSARGDADGNLWVRIVPVSAPAGGFIYDVIDSTGQLVNRYQLPTGYTIMGFGKGKVVYLSMRDAAGLHLVKVRLR